MDVDLTDVEVIGELSERSDELSKMRLYLESLYLWFLLGPIITFVWLRRTKKLCCVTFGRQVDEERATDDEEVVAEIGLHSVEEETGTNFPKGREDKATEDEEQPLTIVVDNPQNNSTTMEHRRYTALRRMASFPTKIRTAEVAVGFGYVILAIAALPVGISSGGLSFLRFDEGEKDRPKSFWDDLRPDPRGKAFLCLWWSTFQTFCLLMYSRFACETTWTGPTNVSKLIRSDWFASNIYLLILCIVEPYCSSLNEESGLHVSQFMHFSIYNTVCTDSNLLFVIILNKHRFFTRYVFYISVCMICAYIESNIVAVYYFALNSQGKLTDLRIAAVRTVAIGLTLKLSFSTSMHIIRKLTKPHESLFVGLAEK